MVPLDQPRSALDMLKRFLRAKPFSDSSQTALSVGSCSGKDALDCSETPGCAPPASAGEVLLPSKLLPPPSPPSIVGTPSVGRDYATVEFTPSDVGGGDGEGQGGEAFPAAVLFFEARSSPDGVVGVGSGSPVVVDGLTPGRTYTFSVTAVYSAGGAGAAGADGGGGEEAEEVRSRPSVGSPAVTPGCGQGGGGGGGGGGAACGVHGVCREGGQEGICLCEDGYAGDNCEVLLAGGVRGGAGGVSVGPETNLDILILREENLPALPTSAKVCVCVCACASVCVLCLCPQLASTALAG